jgi:hypothetical protein
VEKESADDLGRPEIHPQFHAKGDIAGQVAFVAGLFGITTAEIGPCVVAASTAAAPSTANIPGGTPGQNNDQT